MNDQSQGCGASSRVSEVDAALRPLNIAMAAAASACSVVYLPRFGVAFAAFTSTPLLYWLFRLSPIGRRLSIGLWDAVFIAMLVVATTGSAATSGGADSPVVFFTGVIALLAHALFAPRRWPAALGVTSVVVLIGIDVSARRAFDTAAVLAAVVLAGYLPFFVDRMVQIEQRQRRRAVLDQLTGCLNRHALESRSIELEAQADRTGLGLSAIVFDLDQFKAVNDRYGHARGDRVLAHVAYVARKHLRRFELMYRLGGEEFAILLPDATITQATAIAEIVRAAIESTPMDDVVVTASFGVATVTPPFQIAAAIELADQQLYSAKKAGRNTIRPRAEPGDVSEAIPALVV